MRLTIERSKSFAAVGLFLLLSVSGCEKTDYRALQTKERLQGFESALNNSLQTRDELAARIAKLESQVVSLQENQARVIEQPALLEQLAQGRAYWTVDDTSGLVSHVDLSTTRSNDLLPVLEKFPSLTHVTLNGRKADMETFRLLGQLSGLERIDAEQAPVTVEALQELSGLKKLKFLQLFRSDISDEGLGLIANMNGVEQVRVGQTRVSDEGVTKLAALKSLKALDLSDCNRVSDESLNALTAVEGLQFLKVWGPQITDAGMKSIGKMRSLRVLGLNDTGISDEGIAELAGLPELAEIHLFRANVHDKGIRVLAGLPKLTSLNLRDTKLSDEGLEFLANDRIVKLDLSETNSPGLSDASGRFFSRMTRLADLNLWSTSVSDDLVASLIDLPNLKRLNLDKTMITADAIKSSISQMEQLEWLHIGSNQEITDDVIDDLIALPNLKFLNITNSGISDAGFLRLEDALAPRGGTVIGP